MVTGRSSAFYAPYYALLYHWLAGWLVALWQMQSYRQSNAGIDANDEITACALEKGNKGGEIL